MPKKPSKIKRFTIKKGSRIYDYNTEEWFCTDRDWVLEDWDNQIGHIRFRYHRPEDSRVRKYAFETRYNKGNYSIEVIEI